MTRSMGHGTNDAIGGYMDQQNIETNIFDVEEVYHNCTVQILRNSITGEQSIGWWPEELPPVEF